MYDLLITDFSGVSFPAGAWAKFGLFGDPPDSFKLIDSTPAARLFFTFGRAPRLE